MGVTNATYKGFEGWYYLGRLFVPWRVVADPPPSLCEPCCPASRPAERGKAVIRLGSTSHRRSGLRHSPGQLGIVGSVGKKSPRAVRGMGM